jgi:hypothetical protein
LKQKRIDASHLVTWETQASALLSNSAEMDHPDAAH